MINTAQKNLSGSVNPMVKLENPRLAVLREKIHDEEYLNEAIQRIAFIISNELLDMSRGGLNYEQRKRQ